VEPGGSITLEDLVLSIGSRIDAGHTAPCPVCREGSLAASGCDGCSSLLS